MKARSVSSHMSHPMSHQCARVQSNRLNNPASNTEATDRLSAGADVAIAISGDEMFSKTSLRGSNAGLGVGCKGTGLFAGVLVDVGFGDPPVGGLGVGDGSGVGVGKLKRPGGPLPGQHPPPPPPPPDGGVGVGVGVGVGEGVATTSINTSRVLVPYPSDAKNFAWNIPVLVAVHEKRPVLVA